MNSGAKLKGAVGPLVWLALFVGGIVVVLAGCSDHGPTNMYSSTLFGQNQSGGNMQIRGVQPYTLSPSAGGPNGIGPDQYVIWIQNTGPGGVMGPITANVTMQSSCAYIESGATPPVQSASQTVIFGGAQTIYSGQSLVGNANNMSGPYQYSVQVGFPQSCSTTTDTFTVSMSDPKGDHWTGSFSGTND